MQLPSSKIHDDYKTIDNFHRNWEIKSEELSEHQFKLLQETTEGIITWYCDKTDAQQLTCAVGDELTLLTGEEIFLASFK